MTSIGDDASYGCSSLTSIIVAEGNAKYDSRNGCNAIIETGSNTLIAGCSSTVIPESVTSIGSSAFYNCSSLREVINFSNLNIKKGSDSHGYVARYAKKVVKVNEQIGDYYFYTAEDNIHYLQHYIGKDTVINLPEDYNGDDYLIGETAFLNNGSIVSVNVPQTVGTIGKSAFANCYNLATVTLARGVMAIESNAFANCWSLTALVFPKSLTAIGDGAFKGCSGLKTILFSENIDAYGSNVFEGCDAVETMTVKGSVMPTVPSDKITSITLYSPVPLETAEFANKVYRNATVYVPQGSLERYQAASVWKNFWTIKEFDPTGIEQLTINNGQLTIYDLKGRKIEVEDLRELEKGVYIINGRKVLIND